MVSIPQPKEPSRFFSAEAVTLPNLPQTIEKGVRCVCPMVKNSELRKVTLTMEREHNARTSLKLLTGALKADPEPARMRLT